MEHIDELFRSHYEAQGSAPLGSGEWDKLTQQLDQLQTPGMPGDGGSSASSAVGTGAKVLGVAAKKWLLVLAATGVLGTGTYTYFQFNNDAPVTERGVTVPSEENQLLVTDESSQKELTEGGSRAVSMDNSKEGQKGDEIMSNGISSSTTEEEMPTKELALSSVNSEMESPSVKSSLHIQDSSPVEVKPEPEASITSVEATPEQTTDEKQTLSVNENSLPVVLVENQVRSSTVESEEGSSAFLPAVSEATTESGSEDLIYLMDLKIAQFTTLLEDTLSYDESRLAKPADYVQQKGARFTGLRIGAGVSTQSSMGYSESSNAPYSFAPRFSLGYDHYLNSRWIVFANGGYSYSNQHDLIRKESFEYVYFNTTTETHTHTLKELSYLEADLGVGYAFFPKHSLRAGINTVFIIQSKGVLEEEVSGVNYYYSTSKEVEGYREGISDYSFGFMVGYQYDVLNRLSLNLNYRQGFTDMTDDTIYPSAGNNPIRSYELMLIYYPLK